MSEQQGQKWAATTETERNSDPENSDPTVERQAVLRETYEKNIAEGKPPYYGVVIRSRGEFTWVMNKHGWLEVDESGEPPNINLSGADLSWVNLSGASLIFAKLRNATFRNTDLSHADLLRADLSGAYLRGANLKGADLRETKLNGADLREARMDVDTRLDDASLDTHTRLVDVVWNSVPLTRLNWQDVAMLGDEVEARDPRGKRPDGFVNSRTINTDKSMKVPTQPSKGVPPIKQIKQALGNNIQLYTLLAYEDAVTANRQVATVLRSQGLSEHADRYVYRAQVMQRRVFWYRRSWWAFVGSWLFDRIAGYGYRPGRSFLTYSGFVTGFALIYIVFRESVHPALNPLDALIFSITSFHGRGFSPGEAATLHNPLTIFAAIEAIIGLLIEITFIATFTQRFFAK